MWCRSGSTGGSSLLTNCLFAWTVSFASMRDRLQIDRENRLPHAIASVDNESPVVMSRYFPPVSMVMNRSTMGLPPSATSSSWAVVLITAA